MYERCPICGQGTMEPRESVIRATLSGRAEAIGCRYAACDRCGHRATDRRQIEQAAKKHRR